MVSHVVGLYVSSAGMSGGGKPVEPSASVAEQLAEVYALADELHVLTDRIKSKVDSVIATLPPRQEPTDGLGATGARHDPRV